MTTAASPPRYFGVRCACGTYLVLDEAGNERARCDRLEHPAWIVCEGCRAERQYGNQDLIVFTWPPD